MTVTADDVRIAAGKTSLTEVETAQVNAWIADVQMLIEARFGDLSRLNQDRLNYVVKEVVAARLKQPNAGVTADEIAVDDARSVRRYERSSGSFEITDAMWALLEPVRRARGAFMIPLHYQADRRAW